MSKGLPKISLDPGFWTRTSWIQLLYGIWVNMAQLGIGLAFGFPAVQVPQLSSPGSDIVITREEASWIASVLTLLAPIGCLFAGYIIDRFGRRIMIIMSQGPMCIGWLYTGLATTPNHIIIGRAITGIGCGMAMGPPRIYSTEISLPNMRGVIGTFPSVAMSIGICVQAGFGSVFQWQILCFACSIFTFANLLLFNLLPETPYYLLMKDNIDNARKNLAKFRGAKYDLDSEMLQLQEFKMDNNIRKLTMKENLKALFTRASCKPFSIINTYVLITQLSGVNAILMWAVEILMEANSSFDAHTGNFMLTLTRLIVGTITSILLFKVGRKPLALTSAAGVSVVCLSLGGYLHYSTKPSFVPQMCFMAYMAFASLGYNTLPFLMMAEMYPLQVRGTLGGITVSTAGIFIFCTIKLYPLVRDSVGLANTIIIFGVCSLLGTIFLYFFLPETKELTLQEIEEYFNARRPTLVSQRRLMSMQQFSSRSLQSHKSKTSTIGHAFDNNKSTKMFMDDDSSGDEVNEIKTYKSPDNRRIYQSEMDVTLGGEKSKGLTISRDTLKLKRKKFKTEESMHSREFLKQKRTASISDDSERRESKDTLKSRESEQHRRAISTKDAKHRRDAKKSKKIMKSSEMKGSEESTDNYNTENEKDKKPEKNKDEKPEKEKDKKPEKEKDEKSDKENDEKPEKDNKPSTSKK